MRVGRVVAVVLGRDRVLGSPVPRVVRVFVFVAHPNPIHPGICIWSHARVCRHVFGVVASVLRLVWVSCAPRHGMRLGSLTRFET